MNVYLVRHGITDACGLETINNVKPNKDVMLSTLGRDQIVEACKKLPKDITKIYTSPTIRTIETAEIIKNYCDNHPEIIIDIRIKNKVVEFDSSYGQNLNGFINDLKMLKEKNIVLVTHGRIIKMIYSLMTRNEIDCKFMDGLELKYGDVFLMKDFKFLEWNLLFS
jgi:broad specificity phosphatase PhoE